MNRSRRIVQREAGRIARPNGAVYKRLMVKALQNWLNNHELPAIIAGVLGVVVLLSLVLVVGGYWLVAR